MIRSIFAILGGSVLLALIVMAAHAGLAAFLPSWFPISGAGSIPTKAYVFDLALGALGALAAGFITGLLAKRAPTGHALVLAVLILVLGLVHAVTARGSHPAAFLVALPLVGGMSATVGGWLRADLRSRSE